MNAILYHYDAKGVWITPDMCVPKDIFIERIPDIIDSPMRDSEDEIIGKVISITDDIDKKQFVMEIEIFDMERAKQEWGGDYEMVKYEYENQVKAYKALQ